MTIRRRYQRGRSDDIAFQGTQPRICPSVDVLKELGRPPAVAALDGEDAVYAVGGAVRDVLLGSRPHEIDFVVVGDAVAVARRAAERLGGRITVHERFGTATVEAEEATFDLASARRERYERPGALPVVELGASLDADLARRDFTVNAIALHLADGALTFHPGAREDLAERQLRVLHDASFQDDPTRLLRMARYAARLGFEVEPHTDALAAAAIAAGALDTVTGSRLGAELRLLAREPQPAALAALEPHGLGKALLGPAFAVDPELAARAIALTPRDGDPGLAALATTLVGASDVAAVLDRLAFPAYERETVAAAAAATALPALTDVELWRALRDARPETVAVAGALGDPEAARRWHDEVSHRRLAISGHDLVAAGLHGPAVGAALDAATEAMLEGRAPGREEQLAAALSI
jgi:tRNA nucleotidyltransferase (CCA-adding enzyme)